ncbi:hypothetical protein WA158_002042 [Blastocystis sp. Blastoise]
MEVDNKQIATVNATEIETAVKQDEEQMTETQETAPKFAPLTAKDMAGTVQIRRIRCPPNRYISFIVLNFILACLNNWKNITNPITQQLKLQIRFNTKTRSTSEFTEDIGALQKAEDFVHAFFLGFEVQDAIALLRLDDLYIGIYITLYDVKTLKGDHLGRAIGRIAGQNGKTKFAIENATKTRIVLADQKDAVCNLIIGAPPGKVYNQMKQVAARHKDRF